MDFPHTNDKIPRTDERNILLFHFIYYFYFPKYTEKFQGIILEIYVSHKNDKKSQTDGRKFLLCTFNHYYYFPTYSESFQGIILEIH